MYSKFNSSISQLIVLVNKNIFAEIRITAAVQGRLNGRQGRHEGYFAAEVSINRR